MIDMSIKKDLATLTEFINSELTDEWFHDGNETFIDWARILLTKGISVETIKGMFTSLYSAVANEFGS